MIDLYYWPTPNGWKVSILLEELGLDYTLKLASKEYIAVPLRGAEVDKLEPSQQQRFLYPDPNLFKSLSYRPLTRSLMFFELAPGTIELTSAMTPFFAYQQYLIILSDENQGADVIRLPAFQLPTEQSIKILVCLVLHGDHCPTTVHLVQFRPVSGKR